MIMGKVMREVTEFTFYGEADIFACGGKKFEVLPSMNFQLEKEIPPSK